MPVLGICYGEQAMAHQLGGKVESGHHREFGRAEVEVTKPSALYEGVWEVGQRYPVWMSHGDRVTQPPSGFSAVGTSPNAPIAMIADETRRFYATQFHLEVMHTPHGAALLRNFVRNIAGCAPDWTMRAYREEAIERIRKDVGNGKVLCALSGGVDSAVAAVLIHEAIGHQLTCVFVDHGLMRLGEGERVVALFRDHYNIPLVHVARAGNVSKALDGVEDPERNEKPSANSLSTYSRRKRRNSAAPIFLPRARFIPTSSRACRLPAARRSPSNRTTMSGACPRA